MKIIDRENFDNLKNKYLIYNLFRILFQFLQRYYFGLFYTLLLDFLFKQ